VNIDLHFIHLYGICFVEKQENKVLLKFILFRRLQNEWSM